MNPRIVKVDGPAALLNLVPRLVGFRPAESLVLVAFSGKRSGSAMRFDLPTHRGPRTARRLRRPPGRDALPRRARRRVRAGRLHRRALRGRSRRGRRLPGRPRGVGRPRGEGRPLRGRRRLGEGPWRPEAAAHRAPHGRARARRSRRGGAAPRGERRRPDGLRRAADRVAHEVRRSRRPRPRLRTRRGPPRCRVRDRRDAVRRPRRDRARHRPAARRAAHRPRGRSPRRSVPLPRRPGRVRDRPRARRPSAGASRVGEAPRGPRSRGVARARRGGPAREHGPARRRGRRPSVPRIEAALRAIRLALAHLEPADRAPLLGCAAWFEWALGRGSIAGAFVDLALAADPTDVFAAWLGMRLQRGELPEWAFRATPGLSLEAQLRRIA